MPRWNFVAAFTFVFAAILSQAMGVEPSSAERARANLWAEGRFALGHPADLPFSFRYGGKSSRELLPTWKREITTRKREDGHTETILTFAAPDTGLVVRCTAVSYQDFPAIDWVLSFKNAGNAETPILESVKALDANLLALPASAEAKLYYSRGSHALITDFQPCEQTLGQGDRTLLSSFGGRSSDGTLPFFNVASSQGGGVTIDVGWTGQWAASFARASTGDVNVQAGMESLHTKLLPGEEIRSPSIVLVFWDGADRLRGQNLHRRVLLAHYSPTVAGRPVDPPLAASPHAVIGFEKTTESNLRDLIQNIADHQVRFDYWWIDAGWYTCADNWARYVGNPDPDPKRFPQGMKPVADAARKAGMKFLLWFEPERVMLDTWLQQHHPDWLLKPPSEMPSEVKYQFNDGFHLLDLGNPQALAWVIEKLSAMIREAGIDCYRNDFNMYPLYYWRDHEEPDRKGMREIRYITGLYTLFDTLRQRHPALLIDTCASGGRRIDIEMLRRALVLTRSDYLWDPTGQQCHTYGLAAWIPLTGIGVASLDPYSCRSGLGSHFSFAVNYASKDPEVWRGIVRLVNEYRSLKSLYIGDFFPLGGYSTSDDTWMAWQFDRPDLGEGMVQAFRRKDAANDSATYRLSGLNKEARYELTNLDQKSSEIVSGRDLSEKGLTVRLTEKPGAAVIRYRKVGN